jgi:hypothetical protein
MTGTNALCTTLIREVGDLWFSTNPAEREQAKQICRRCPLLTACAQAGLDAGPNVRGVWGGMSSGDRRVFRTGERAADPDDEPEDGPVRRRERQPCGTEAAFLAHSKFGEPCEPCTTAHDARVEADRWARLATRHGTDAGHRMHRVLRDTPCGDCRVAAIAKRAENRARQIEEGRVAWAQRGAVLLASAAAQGAQEAAA